MRPEERRGLLYVALAVAFFSTSPLFIVWADPMSPFIKTWGRMTVAAVLVGIAAWVEGRRIRGKESGWPPGGTPEIPGVEPPVAEGDLPREAIVGAPRSFVRFAAYGLIAALHFFFYIASLNFTTAAHSLSIIYTAPIFVTLLSAALLHEPIRRRQWLGVGVAVAGIAIVAGLQPQLSRTMAFGDLLALLSAITFGFYSIAGRYERDRYPLLVYASRVYGAAALWLLPVALLSIPSAPPDAWGWKQIGSVIGMGVGSLALGHTLYNASLRRVHATYVNIVASQEVTGGIILSWLFLAQVPTLNSLVGALITLIGIGLVLR
jgi:drug/metabolite transporter (DMT)-like permease